MNTTKQLADLLNTWCDGEMERCKAGVKSMEESSIADAHKQNIQNVHTEISMYQSFKNRIKSIMDETGIGCQHKFAGGTTTIVADWKCIYCNKSQNELNGKIY